MKAKQIGWILVGAAVGILVACSGSSSADTGLTQSQVQTMITAAVSPLQQQIATLQTQVQTLQASTGSVARVFITAPNASAATALARRVTRASSGAPCTGIGTLTGRPSTSDPMSSGLYSGISCTGYYFDISGAIAGGVANLQPLPYAQYIVAYDGANCTGDAYLVPRSDTVDTLQILAQSGMVFLFDPNTVTPSPTVAANYWYLKAGTTAVPFTEASLSYGALAQPCTDASVTVSGFSFTSGFPIQANDSAVTGIPSAPIPGPVLISN
ncbi:MAG: hypothetical protein KGL39_28480 [Patescibacteria group bacterium]|nr:hypothetical protein [Patescibacteria group bacterium]